MGLHGVLRHLHGFASIRTAIAAAASATVTCARADLMVVKLMVLLMRKSVQVVNMMVVVLICDVLRVAAVVLVRQVGFRELVVLVEGASVKSSRMHRVLY